MRIMTYSILLAALVTTGASVAVSAATDEATRGNEHPMKDGMMMGMMDKGMMSEMRDLMKDCREMMHSMQTDKAAE
ncbi:MULTISPECIES: hypothetical protein [Pseudomonas]|uniref:hypothetical protein n=1 Tax=Pseudomonas TaxID=286 RepID=UPI00123854D2|nr:MULTISPECIES: hypothetical protein [Pseudomonas]QIB51312.1 hypothetical protein G3M63_09780 [Pseudomonas sp. OIL-1]